MKNKRLIYGLMAAGLFAAGFTQSCVSDEPFGNGSGEGTLRMQLVVSSELTRAETDEEDLTAKCLIAISQVNRGLLYKYEGVKETPEELRLKAGNYVAEAWTGDSVTASFDSKFYRGYQKFDIQDSDRKQIVLKCRIANVVVSIDPESVEKVGIKNWTLNVSNSRGDLTFVPEDIEKKGYFMMPDVDKAVGDNGQYVADDDEGFYKYIPLNYTLTGETADGRSFTKKGTIADADGYTRHAHDYMLKMKYNPEYEEAGGGIIDIEIVDDALPVQEEIGLYARPTIKGVTFDIDHQIQGAATAFGRDEIFKVSAFKSIVQLQLLTGNSELNIDNNGVDLYRANEEVLEKIKNSGITWEEKYNKEKDIYTCYVTLSRNYLNSLPEGKDEYVLRVSVKDGNGRVSEGNIRIAVGEEAVKEDDPVTVDPFNPSNDYLAVRAHRITLSGTLSAEAQSPVIMYRTAGSQEQWQSVAVPVQSRGKSFSVEIKGLEKSRQYEYKAADGEWVSNTVNYFTTEPEFPIPFADMETWSTQGKAPFVGNDYDNNFWDSGNHGSASFGFTLTQASTTMFNSAGQSAKLESIFAGIGSLVGKFAAGNLFVGKFGGTVGTDGAYLDFGQPYDGSHPDALTVWANYRPAKIGYIDGRVPSMKNGDPDQGQIFVAFATKAQSINTAKGIFFNPDDESILGYGEAPWKQGDSFGPDGKLEQLTIPITWNKKAATVKPTHIIIVCSASKYGDYFVGAKGSILYLDDFELVYE